MSTGSGEHRALSKLAPQPELASGTPIPTAVSGPPSSMCRHQHPIDSCLYQFGASQRARVECSQWSRVEDPGLSGRVSGWWVDAAQDPGKPTDAELEFIAGVVVGAGIGRNVLAVCIDGVLRLTVDGDHNGTV